MEDFITEKKLLKLGFEKTTDHYVKLTDKKSFILMHNKKENYYYLCDCDVLFKLNTIKELDSLFFLAYKKRLINK